MPSNSAVRAAKAKARAKAALDALLGDTSPDTLEIAPVWATLERRVVVSEARQTRADPGPDGDLGIDLGMWHRAPSEPDLSPLPIVGMEGRPYALPSLRGYTNQYYWCERAAEGGWLVIEYSRYGEIVRGRYTTPEDCHARQCELKARTRYRGKGCTLAEANLIIESLPADHRLGRPYFGATWPPEK